MRETAQDDRATPMGTAKGSSGMAMCNHLKNTGLVGLAIAAEFLDVKSHVPGPVS